MTHVFVGNDVRHYLNEKLCRFLVLLQFSDEAARFNVPAIQTRQLWLPSLQNTWHNRRRGIEWFNYIVIHRLNPQQCILPIFSWPTSFVTFTYQSSCMSSRPHTIALVLLDEPVVFWRVTASWVALVQYHEKSVDRNKDFIRHRRHGICYSQTPRPRWYLNLIVILKIK